MDFSIVSPRTDWVYHDDVKIMLAVNVNTQDIIWRSDRAGVLGEGNHLTLFLPVGLHNISAEIMGVTRKRYATVAHELAHLSTFTGKTWSRIRDGQLQAPREELFLEEGWSHLTESLLGFGVSGGNIRFFERFLNNTSMYSFCGPNRLGQNDSAGMRGAISFFCEHGNFPLFRHISQHRLTGNDALTFQQGF
jgi:hypothetical protein